MVKMKRLKSKRFVSIVPVLLLITLLIASAGGCEKEAEKTNNIVVAVTLLPQAGFVEAIAGDKVEVVVMVPPGASPHTYEVTPDQMTQLSRAKMYAKVGSPVEFELAWMDKLIAVNKSMLVVDCSQGVQLIEMTGEEHEHEAEAESGHEHEGLDPHIWLSIKNAKIMVQNICDGLVQIDSANKTYYEKNCADYMDKLIKLDSELAADLSGVANRSFIVFHPSFGYFARDYNLIQIGVEQEGKEPDADYIIRLIKEAREQNIKVVFVSPQYSAKSAESIAGEINGKVVIIDPLAKDFIGNMRTV
jgi:zinc transport system substrate-binding protein